MIEIAGYRVLRPLGHGGMATVYLAVQESVQREVALKVMSPTLLGDAQFRERFLREARIAAQLRHRHVVQVHDVGVHGAHHFIAMEYVPGGSVLPRGGGACTPDFALRVVREIAEALHYAHARGVVHRDIKPDNILLREDGSAALTDFGIARANDITRMTRTGAIVGTPHYMSPEQARGQSVDGRADLYSLGIVFHELLVGRVPYAADDSLAVGIMHITAPLPRLPASLVQLQPLLDALLAKQPDQRFQDGAELAAAIALLQAGAVPPGAVPPSPAIPGQTDRAPSGRAPSAAQRGAQQGAYNDPVLGSLDEVASTPPPRRRKARARRSGAGWMLALLLLAGTAAALWHYQDRLRALLPDAELTALLDEAARALAQGRYGSDDGRGARQLYAAVLARDPDNQAARDGLRAVGDGLLQAARAALARGDTAAARDALRDAAALAVPAAELDALSAQVQARERDGVALGTLLEQARSAAASGQLEDAGDGNEPGALALYQRARTLAPDDARLRAEWSQLLDAALQRAREYGAEGNHDAAQALVERVAREEPGHLGLPGAQADLAERRRAREGVLAQRLDAAEQLLQQGRLVAPTGNNARAAFAAVLQQDPGNERARAGLSRVAAALITQAGRASADYEFQRATALLDEAARTGAADNGELAAARKRLHDAEQRHRRRFAASSVDPERDARVSALLQQAGAAAAAGRLLAPPGDSAYDRYRAARALDPDNPAALAGLASLPAQARTHFQTALGSNRLSDAHGYVQALESLAPTDPALADMRQRLARSLRGYADERLGAGEFERAAGAIDRAGELEPTHPELVSLRARLEQATGG